MGNRMVTEEALLGMIQSLHKFQTEVSECIVQLQNDANTCADNMQGDEYSAKAIININKCLQYYRQLYDKVGIIADKMQKKYSQLEEMANMMNGDDY